MARYLETRFTLRLALVDNTERIALTGSPIQSGLERLPIPITEFEAYTALDTEYDEAQINEISALLAEISRLSTPQNKPAEEGRLGNLIATSDAMFDLFKRSKNVASTNATILILGENGTGKDLLAQAIHENSNREKGPFIVQNCAAVPADLIESEFFGHKKGAFSGAIKDREGLFKRAHGGTLFLDEIGDMPMAMQTKLLRVVETGCFMPVGGDSTVSVDVRLIFATHRDLAQMVSKNTFRQDLYYRINVVELPLPPLRERRGGVGLLSQYFLSRFAQRGYSKKTLTEDALAFLESREWPGNVRQLENALERALIFSGESEKIQIKDFSKKLPKTTGGVLTLSETMPQQVAHLEKRLILLALKKTAWNKTRASKVLGISRRNLIRKIAKFELEKRT